MAVGGEDDSKKYFRERKMNVFKVNMKYDRLSVLMRHDSRRSRVQVLPTRARNNDTWDRRRIVNNMR
jgi:hypothetical protein